MPVPVTVAHACTSPSQPRTSPSSLIRHTCSSSYGSRSHQSHMSMQPALLPHPVSIYLSLPCLPRLSRLAPHAASILSSLLILTPSTHSYPSLFIPVPPLSCALRPPVFSSSWPIRFPTVLRLASFITRHAILTSMISSSPSNESAQETKSQYPLAAKWICFPS